MGFMSGVKGLGRTILGSNEAIQRGGQNVYNNMKGVRDVAEAFSGTTPADADQIKQAKSIFKGLLSDEGFSAKHKGVAKSDAEKAQAVAQHYQSNKGTYDSSIDRMGSTLENMKKGNAQENFAALRDGMGLDDSPVGNGMVAGLAIDGYLRSGSKKTNAIRYGAMGAGHMGLSFVGRSLTGGSMTQNNKGERDIAGIPFV